MKKKSFMLVLTLASKKRILFKKYNNLIAEFLNNNNISLEGCKKLAPFVKDYYFSVNNKNFINKINNIFNKKKFSEVDICVQEKKYRKKKIIACDMDMTAIKEETLNIIGEKVLNNDLIKNLTTQAMSGEIKFQEAIILRTKMLQGIKKSKILDILKDISFTPGIKSVIRTMNHNGCHTMLITGGYNLIAEYVAREIGFKEVVSNSLIFENGIVTGKLGSEIIDRDMKLKYFQKSVIENNIKSFETLAVGDGDNDIKMIEFASLGVAWKAYPKVRFAADICLNNDMKNILYFQGYSKKQIIN